MIKTKKRKLKIKGSVIELGSDYAKITSGLIDAFVEGGIPRDEAVKMVAKAHQLGTMTK